MKQNYLNLRTQCFYEVRHKINDYEMFVSATGKIKEMVAQELRAIMKAESIGDGKIRMNSKDEIKAIIGRSPNFADVISMRVVFDLAKPKKRAGTVAY